MMMMIIKILQRGCSNFYPPLDLFWLLVSHVLLLSMIMSTRQSRLHAPVRPEGTYPAIVVVLAMIIDLSRRDDAHDYYY